MSQASRWATIQTQAFQVPRKRTLYPFRMFMDVYLKKRQRMNNRKRYKSPGRPTASKQLSRGQQRWVHPHAGNHNNTNTNNRRRQATKSASRQNIKYIGFHNKKQGGNDHAHTRITAWESDGPSKRELAGKQPNLGKRA